MKRIFSILAAALLTASVFAQTPQKMSYQAVIRNSSNALVTNQQVGMQISILQGSANGTAVYVETQTPTTNANGLVSIEIGAGTMVSGNFSSINWANGPYFIKTETDPTGGTNYTITGTSQLLSVPYALHAKTAESVTGTITETDPVFSAWDKDYNDLINKPQIPTVPTNVSAFTNDAGYLTSEADSSVMNEIQTLSIQGNNLSISNGNTVQIPSSGSLWVENSGNIYRNSGNVGIGLNNPQAPLDINVNQGSGNIQNIINFSGTSGGTADIASFQYDDGASPNPLILNMNPQNDYARAFVITGTGSKVGIGLTNPKSKLQVNGGIQVSNDTDAASADKEGTLRYRTDGNNSYVEICMKTGPNSYSWVIIKQNTW